jgi:hypothetical protein
VSLPPRQPQPAPFRPAYAETLPGGAVRVLLDRLIRDAEMPVFGLLRPPLELEASSFAYFGAPSVGLDLVEFRFDSPGVTVSLLSHSPRSRWTRSLQDHLWNRHVRPGEDLFVVPANFPLTPLGLPRSAAHPGAARAWTNAGTQQTPQGAVSPRGLWTLIAVSERLESLDTLPSHIAPLERHPGVVRRMRQELETTFGNRPKAPDGAPIPALPMSDYERCMAVHNDPDYCKATTGFESVHWLGPRHG